MPTPDYLIKQASALLNDAAQTKYNNTSVLPYFNMSLDILQEIYELNNIPTTNQTSAAIVVKSGVAQIGFDTTPALPSELIEIQQLWESPHGINQWTPVVKKEFIPHYLEDGTSISQFLIWSWKDDHITVIPANADNDLKLDFIGKIFNTPILIGNIKVNLPFTNITTYLEFETAALCAYFIMENPERGDELSSFAADALSRALNIPLKGMQNIITRRRPFRASFKRRGITY